MNNSNKCKKSKKSPNNGSKRVLPIHNHIYKYFKLYVKQHASTIQDALAVAIEDFLEGQPITDPDTSKTLPYTRHITTNSYIHKLRVREQLNKDLNTPQKQQFFRPKPSP